MFSSVGYISVFEIARQIESKRSAAEANLVLCDILPEAAALYISNNNGSVTRLTKDVLAKHNGQYVFLDETNWTISLDRVRDAWMSRSPTSLSVGLWVLANHDPNTDISKNLPDELLPFEGQPLALSDEDEVARPKFIEMKIGEFQLVYQSRLAVHHDSENSVLQAFQNFAASMNGKSPTTAMQKDWCKANYQNGKPITQRYYNKLKFKHAPPSWSLRGRRS